MFQAVSFLCVVLLCVFVCCKDNKGQPERQRFGLDGSSDPTLVTLVCVGVGAVCMSPDACFDRCVPSVCAEA